METPKDSACSVWTFDKLLSGSLPSLFPTLTRTTCGYFGQGLTAMRVSNPTPVTWPWSMWCHSEPCQLPAPRCNSATCQSATSPPVHKPFHQSHCIHILPRIPRNGLAGFPHVRVVHSIFVPKTSATLLPSPSRPSILHIECVLPPNQKHVSSGKFAALGGFMVSITTTLDYFLVFSRDFPE